MSSPNAFPLPISLTRASRGRAALFGIVVAEVLILIVPGEWWGIGGLAAIGAVLMLGLLTTILGGRGKILLLGWILTFPLGYYFLSFPREGALFTLDRFLVVALLISQSLAVYSEVPRISRTLRNSAVCWTLFVLFSGVAAARAATPLSSFRIWLEAFVFPAVLAWYVLRYFDVRGALSALHVCTCLMATYVTAIGFAEVILLRDLLPLPGGGFVVAGDYTDVAAQILPRPNGPFATNNSFAMVGLVSLFFLLFLRGALAGKMPRWQKLLHRVGVSAALLEALLPLFRSVLISLVVIIIVDVFYQSGWRRFLRVGAIACLGLSFLSLGIVLPSVFEERAESGTLYARIAQQKQTLALFADHPINGIGLSNFTDALGNSKYLTYYEDAEALGSAHNNLGAILAETGLTGFLPFVASQVLLVAAFWKRRASSTDSQLVWKIFMFLFLCYWINGMALTTAYYADLNLWYIFVMAILYKFAITNPEANTPTSPHFAPGI